MDRIKLVAVDMDDTLLDPLKQISSRNRQALRNAAERGIEIVPASGRSLKGLPPELLEEEFGVKHAIVLNGAFVLDLSAQAILKKWSMGYEDAASLYEFCRGLGRPITVYLDGRGYMTRADMERLPLYAPAPMMAYYHRSRKIAADDGEIRGRIRENGGIVKLSVTKQYGRESLSDVVFPEKLSGYTLAHTPDALEFTAEGATKGNALVFLAEYLGIPMEQVMAIGDSENDLSMITAAGTGVAMANSTPQVLRAADRVTEDNEHDGVAVVLEEAMNILSADAIAGAADAAAE